MNLRGAPGRDSGSRGPSITAAESDDLRAGGRVARRPSSRIADRPGRVLARGEPRPQAGGRGRRPPGRGARLRGRGQSSARPRGLLPDDPAARQPDLTTGTSSTCSGPKSAGCTTPSRTSTRSTWPEATSLFQTSTRLYTAPAQRIPRRRRLLRRSSAGPDAPSDRHPRAGRPRRSTTHSSPSRVVRQHARQFPAPELALELIPSGGHLGYFSRRTLAGIAAGLTPGSLPGWRTTGTSVPAAFRRRLMSGDRPARRPPRRPELHAQSSFE